MFIAAAYVYYSTRVVVNCPTKLWDECHIPIWAVSYSDVCQMSLGVKGVLMIVWDQWAYNLVVDYYCRA